MSEATAPTTPDNSPAPAVPAPAAAPVAAATATPAVVPSVSTTDAAPAAASGAGDSYTFTWPEGFTPDATIVAEYEKEFREAGISNDVAQKLVGRYAAQQLAAHQSLDAEVQKQTDAWKLAVQNDPDLGGAKLAATVKSAETAMARFGSADLKTWLDTTGMSNHPELVRFFAKVGALASEDTFAGGNARSGAGRNSIESRMYPNQSH